MLIWLNAIVRLCARLHENFLVNSSTNKPSNSLADKRPRVSRGGSRDRVIKKAAPRPSLEEGLGGGLMVNAIAYIQLFRKRLTAIDSVRIRTNSCMECLR